MRNLELVIWSKMLSGKRGARWRNLLTLVNFVHVIMCLMFMYLEVIRSNDDLFVWQAYSSKDLSGLKVEHSTESFREGRDIVLTLKDKGKMSMIIVLLFNQFHFLVLCERLQHTCKCACTLYMYAAQLHVKGTCDYIAHVHCTLHTCTCTCIWAYNKSDRMMLLMR